MIDAKLIKQAKEKSEVIESIDSSWRSYVDKLKESISVIPFKGSYNALVEDDYVLVEGYCGLLLIDKVYCNHKTYRLKKPVNYYPFRIYGVYDSRGVFEDFVARPEIGFHYMGMSNQGHTICTGEISYVNPDSLALLKEASLKIISSFRLINMESLGTVILPEGYAELKSIFSNKDEGAKTKFGKLVNEGLIEEIL
jgi:hypothetical protein